MDSKSVPLEIRKAQNDKKSYKIVNNLHSGLEVLLISTATTLKEGDSSRKAAAALSVQVGSYADPPVAEGCAHFLEHMLFMGSEKYPDENHYDSYISGHGGSCNAFTEGEYTCYQFDVDAPFLAASLDIFLQCFRAPLLAPSAVDREVKAIHNEFNIAKIEDANRTQQVFCHQCSDDHVLRKFSWGNRQSLQDAPAKKGVDVQSILRAFYRRHYSPSAMKLVVVGPQSLTELEQAVWAAAGDWQAEPVAADENELPCLSDCLGCWVGRPPIPAIRLGQVTRIAAVKKSHKLLIQWQLPPIAKDYKNKQYEYIGHLLGHEGSGSLLSNLKRLQLATNLSAGLDSSSNFDSNSMFSIFSLSIQLSESGLANWMAVVFHLCRYIDLIKSDGIQEWVFQELKQLAQVSFDFMDEEEEEDLAERLSVEMLPLHGRDRSELLQASFLQWDFDPAAVLNTLTDHFDIRHAKIDILSPVYKGKKSQQQQEESDEDDDDEEDDDDDDDDEDDDDDSDGSEESTGQVLSPRDMEGLYQGGNKEVWKKVIAPPPLSRPPRKEPHFGTLFWCDDIPAGLYAFWEGRAAAGFGPSPSILYRLGEYHLPPPNPFIATDLALIPPTTLEESAGGSPPVAISSRDGLQIWHSLCTKYETPKAELYFRFASKLLIGPRNAFFLDLFAVLLKEKLNEILYTAAMADLECHFIVSDIGLTIRISGYSHRAPYLAEMVTQALLQSPSPDHDSSSGGGSGSSSSNSGGVSGSSSGGGSGSSSSSSSNSSASSNSSGSGSGSSSSSSSDSSSGGGISSSSNGSSSIVGDLAMVAMQLQQLKQKYSNALIKASSLASTARLLSLKPSKAGAAEKLQVIMQEFETDSQKPKPSSSSSKAAKRAKTADTTNDSKNSNKKADVGSTSHNNVCAALAAELKNFHRSFLRAVSVDVLVEGNLSRESAASFSSSIIAALSKNASSTADATTANGDTNTTSGVDITALSGSHFPEQPIVKLPPRNIIVLKQIPSSPKEKNVCIEVYFQCCELKKDVNLDSLTKMDLLEQILSEPFFDNLRTKKQLGYELSCGARHTFGVLGFCFRVVSSSHSSGVLLEELLRFAHTCSEAIIARTVSSSTTTATASSTSTTTTTTSTGNAKKTSSGSSKKGSTTTTTSTTGNATKTNSSKEVNTTTTTTTSLSEHIQALLTKKTTPYKSLREQAEGHWAEVEDRRYDFTVNQKEAQVLKEMLAGDAELAKADLTRFAWQLFNEQPRMLVVVAAQKHKQLDAHADVKALREKKKKGSNKNPQAGGGAKKTGGVADVYASYCDVSVVTSAREIHKICLDRYNSIVA